VTACILGALGALVGGWLVGRWCLGAVLIAESGLGAAWGLLREAAPRPAPREVPGQGVTLAEIWDRARSAP
jgi:hypothetical protein